MAPADSFVAHCRSEHANVIHIQKSMYSLQHSAKFKIYLHMDERTNEKKLSRLRLGR